jgi:hypothetical protein
MTDYVTDTLDVALERLRAGELLATILADYPAEAEVLSPMLKAAASLEAVRQVEMPASEAWQADRADFLAEVTKLQQQAVSARPFVRLQERVVHVLPWSKFNQPYSGRRQRRMSTLLIKAMLVVGLLFGSAGATAAMASNSLPDSPLYPVKLALEDTRLALTTDPAEQAKLHLVLAQERIQEMEQLALKGGVPGEATLTRLQHHLNYALQLASQLPDEAMVGVLIQTQQMAQTQAQQMTQTQAQVGEQVQEPLQQANRLLNQVRQDVEAGLQDPLAFRHRFGHSRPEDAPVQPEPEPGFNRDSESPDDTIPVDEPAPPEEPVPVVEPEPSVEPPQNTEDAPNCSAGDCNQHQYGRASDTLPGHYGECDASGECEPAGGENKYGQDPDFEPGHLGECDTPDECVPAGDENKYGQKQDNQSGPNEPGGTSGNGNGDQAGDQDQDQTQNRDQDRSQDQEGIQLQDRDRDQIQDQDQDQDQDQSQDNSGTNDSSDSNDAGSGNDDSSSSKDDGSSSGGNSGGGGKK